MTTRKELQEWLERFPEDTIIEFAFQDQALMYESWGCITFETPKLENSDIGEGWEYTDFKGNPYTDPESPNYNKKFLTLGESQ